MKRKDLKNCCICNQGVGAAGMMFYQITTESFLLDMQAIQRQNGLEQMMGGSAAIAQVMGPDEDLANRLCRRTLIVCLECMMSKELAMLLEVSSEEELESKAEPKEKLSQTEGYMRIIRGESEGD